MLQVQIVLKVKEVAQERGITRAKLSRIADVAPATLDKIWRNPHHEIYLSTLARLAYALRVSVETLYHVNVVEVVEENDWFSS